MLIRTQDGERLINIDRVIHISADPSMIETRLSRYEINAGTAQGLWKLGSYTSKSNAIIVLDTIQSEYAKYIYGRGGVDTLTGETHQSFAFTPPKVFQMPSDEEIMKGAVKDE